MMFEIVLQQCVFDDFVVTMIFAFVLERPFPGMRISQLVTRNNRHYALTNWNAVVMQHGKTRIHLVACHPERSRRVPWNCRWVSPQDSSTPLGMTQMRLSLRSLRHFVLCDLFQFDYAVANVHVALRKRKRDSRFTKLFDNSKV